MARHRKWGSGRRKRKAAAPEDRLAEGIEHHRAGRLDKAAAAYEDVLAKDPRSAPAWSMKGVLALQRDRPEEAIEPLQRATALDDTQPGFFLNLGNALRGVGRLADAVDAYRRAIELDPQMAPAHNNLGNALRDQDSLAEAAASYQRAIDLSPDFFAAASNLAQTQATLDVLPRAELIASYERAISIADTTDLRTTDVANAHNALGNLLQSETRFEAAATHYRRAISIDPDFGEAHLNLGQALARCLKLEDAIEPTRRGLELRPDDLASYKRLALLLRRLQRNDEATAVYQAWHRQDPGDPIAAHMASVGGDQQPPERAADDYVAREFDDFAEKFDQVLVDELRYQAPALVAQALERTGLTERRELHVLDAGCGTGLCVDFLRPLARHLVGVDLSPKMLDKARDRGGYDELVEAELTAYLESHPQAFDIVVAADVVLYFGRLDALARALRSSLRPGGGVVFTVEAGTNDARGWALGDGGRYTHHPTYLRRVLEDADLQVRELVDDRLRYELGAEVRGWIVTACAPEPQ
ncbi:MAG: tetratricopeptide repeat protein [Myxococcota bacterium]